VPCTTSLPTSYVKIFARCTRFLRAIIKLGSRAIQMAMGGDEGELEGGVRKAAVASRALKTAAPVIDDMIYQLDSFQLLEEANDLNTCHYIRVTSPLCPIRKQTTYKPF